MKANDQVIYVMISLPELGLIFGNEYTVASTHNCGCSDNLHIDVGIKQGKNFVYCEYCGEITCMDERYFLHNSGFRTVEQVAEMSNSEICDVIEKSFSQKQ